MNAVVLTVKSCYVASTKYPRLSVTEKGGETKSQKPLVVWKMKVKTEFKLKTARSILSLLESNEFYLNQINSPLLDRL